MKSKELKNYNLPDNRTYNETLDAKPMKLLLVIMIIGFIVLICKQYIYGACIFFLSIYYCILFLPSRRIIEFYDDFMIVYNKARKDECNIVYYDDIKSWEYKVSVSSDQLVITLKDFFNKK